MKKTIYLILLFFSSNLIYGQTYPSGSLSSNATWSTAGNPYIIEGDFIIDQNVTLTIQAGVVVKFTSYYNNIIVNGNLVAQGSQGQNIIFTSIEDDIHGGDTNNDGNATTPAPNQWASVQISESGSATLDYCWFGYGAGESVGLLDVLSNNVSVDHCTFTQSGEQGIYLVDASIDVQNSNFIKNRYASINFIGLGDDKPVILSNNVFSDSEWAVFANFKDNATSVILEGNMSTGAFTNNFGRNGFAITGSLTGDKTFQGQSDFPFIVTNDFTIQENASVLITPGTTFKFEDYYDNLHVHGTLTAEGTDIQPIYFTSLFDDEHGGDTNGDGLTEGAPGEWASVQISETGTGIFDYCWFGYGGGESIGLLDALSNNVDINHCTFTRSLNEGIYAKDVSLQIYNSNFYENPNTHIFIDGLSNDKDVILQNNTFSNSQWAVYSIWKDNNTSVILSDNAASGIWTNGIGRNGFGITGTLSGDKTFQGQVDFPFIVTSDFAVQENATLLITSGTTFKFEDYYDNLNVHGTLKANGSSTNPIRFTSLIDDCIGGDTNGDGDLTSPAINQWGSIHLSATSKNNEISYVEMHFGGGESFGILDILSSSTEVSNTAITNSGEHGIYIQDASPNIERTILQASTYDGIAVVGTSEPIIENCDFLGNSRFGLSAQFSFEAGINYWGSSKGPVNASSNPDGTGDAINDNVIISDWLESLSDQDLVDRPSFISHVHGKDVALENTSSFSGEFKWVLEGENPNAVISPFFSIPTPGEYEICLEGSSSCNLTLKECQFIGIKGISNFEPRLGGNTGTVTVNIEAGAIDELTASHILDEFGAMYTATNIVNTGNGSIAATFNLEGANIANAKIILEYNDGQEIASDDPFQIIQGTKAEPWLELLGRNAALVNTWTTYEIKFGNRGNVDAYGVPLWIAFDEIPGIEVDFTNVSFSNSQYSDEMGYTEDRYSDLDNFVILDSIFGELKPTRVYPLYLPKIPANQEFSIKLRIKSSEDYRLRVWRNDPYFASPFNGQFALCMAGVIAGRVFELIPGAACANTVIGSIFKPTDAMQGKNTVFVMPQVRDYFNIMVDCGGSIFGGITFAKNIIDLVLNFRDDVKALKDCHDNFNRKDPKDKPVNVVQSFDPNEKIGPTGIGDENYLAYQEEFSYTILFENKKDATAPAHTIIIRDTLDTDVFDLNSLVFENITVGNYDIAPLPGARNFAGQIEMNDLGVLARIVSTLDMGTGVIEWTFTSIDPITLDPIEDPFVGMLPPNLNSPEGEGAVRFSVKLKRDPEHLLSIGNNASIYFDANEPIITEDYINIFDLEAPTSEINGLSTINNDTIIELNWTGVDPESGIDYYEIWMSEEGAPDSLIQIIPNGIMQSSFIGELGTEYSFYSIAIDRVGNREEVPAAYDASTTVTNTQEENRSISKFVISPNPAMDQFQVELELLKSAQIQIGVKDLLGREIINTRDLNLLQGESFQEKISLDTEAGVYLIYIKMEGKTYYKKLVIQ